MAPFSVLRFFSEQRKTLPDPPQRDLTGKVVIVTGSNVGLGFEAAKHLATLKPATIIIACRSVQKGEDAAAKIKAATGTQVEVWQLDLASLKQTKSFGERCLTELDRLDIFIANAGVNTTTPTFTEDGFETTLQVNNIANNLLCAMLLPLLQKTAQKSSDFKPHLTIVGSDVHYAISKLPGSDAGDGKILQAMNESFIVPGFAAGATRYNESKTVNYFNCQSLARLAGDSVVVNVLSPGLCHSELGRGNGLIANGLFTVMRALLARSTEVGSRCITWAALEGPTGVYSESMGVQEGSDYVISEKGKRDGDAIFEEMQEIWKDKVGWTIGA